MTFFTFSNRPRGTCFALTLTFLSPDASALTLQPSCLVPSDDPLAKFFSIRTPSVSLHPSFVVLSSRVSSLSYPSDVLVTTLFSRPPFTVCLPFFFPPFHPLAVEVRYDEEPESLPMFISINKMPCEMDWPRNPFSLPTTPLTLAPSLPSCCPAVPRLSRFRTGSVQSARGCMKPNHSVPRS